MSRRETLNIRIISSTILAAATFVLVLTYVLGAQAILQTSYAEPAHELFMSMYMPLDQGMGSGHQSMSQMHGGLPEQSQSETGVGVQNHNQFGIIGNNILGSPTGLAAGGFASVVVMGAIILATAAFLISWKQRSRVVAGILMASGISLMILPLANLNFLIPGPVLGIVAGLGIIGLGTAKGIEAARGGAVATR